MLEEVVQRRSGACVDCVAVGPEGYAVTGYLAGDKSYTGEIAVECDDFRAFVELRCGFVGHGVGGTAGHRVLLGGLAAILEQTRMRMGLRRARKESDFAVDEREKATALLDNAAAEAAGLRSELAELREELRTAGETQLVEEPLTAFSDDPDDETGSPASAGGEGVGSVDQPDSEGESGAGSGAADDTATKTSG